MTPKRLFYLGIFLSFFAFLSAARSQSFENSPRFLIHLLDYLALDYGGAVSEGQVTNAFEYQEQLEFVDQALRLKDKLPEFRQNAALAQDLEKLKQMIQQKADPGFVAGLARDLQSRVIKMAKIEMAPSQWPNLAQGETLFEKNCSSCHGNNGEGNGEAALSLTPKPTNFHDPARMEGLSPFQVFNVIRMGVPGTGMADFSRLSDREIWDLAFYVLSLRHQRPWQMLSVEEQKKLRVQISSLPLSQVAGQSDQKLKEAISDSPEGKEKWLAALRNFSGSSQNQASLIGAKALLQEALTDYTQGNYESARQKALRAYLEGVEPIEPRLNSIQRDLTLELEQSMGEIRRLMEERAPIQKIQGQINHAFLTLQKAEDLLAYPPSSSWFTFLMAASIILREGFEAILIIIAILGVLRVTGQRKALLWVHGGWSFALLLGLLAWFFSGWLMAISGAQRELMEGLTSLLAVLVLLYVGFWLHSKTEMGRWVSFIDGRTKQALESKNWWGLALISFMAVFREAFETVLFLRALWIEGGALAKTALAMGVMGALFFIFLLAFLLLRFSVRLPIGKLFTFSSAIMALLSVVLVGKGFHALQEGGILKSTPLSLHFRLDLFGFYPTLETLLSQFVIVFLIIILWWVGRRPSPIKAAQAG